MKILISFLGRYLGWFLMGVLAVALLWGIHSALWEVYSGFLPEEDPGCWLPEQTPIAIGYGPQRGVVYWVVCEEGRTPIVRDLNPSVK